MSTVAFEVWKSRMGRPRRMPWAKLRAARDFPLLPREADPACEWARSGPWPVSTGGKTEVVAEASIDLTGRIMQVGRGMIEGVSHQLFLQFIACVQTRLETPAGSDGEAEAAVAKSEPIRIVPLVFGVIWSSIRRFFRGLFGGASS